MLFLISIRAIQRRKAGGEHGERTIETYPIKTSPAGEGSEPHLAIKKIIGNKIKIVSMV